MQNIQLVERKRKSERLAKDEHKAFVKLYHSYPTKIDAAIYFELSRQVLDMVVVRGSGSPDTVRAIRKKLNAAQI